MHYAVPSEQSSHSHREVGQLAQRRRLPTEFPTCTGSATSMLPVRPDLYRRSAPTLIAGDRPLRCNATLPEAPRVWVACASAAARRLALCVNCDSKSLVCAQRACRAWWQQSQLIDIPWRWPWSCKAMRHMISPSTACVHVRTWPWIIETYIPAWEYSSYATTSSANVLRFGRAKQLEPATCVLALMVISVRRRRQ